MMTQAQITAKVLSAVKADYVSTKGLATWLRVSREQVIAAFDAIEAKHPGKFMRVRGFEGGMGR